MKQKNFNKSYINSCISKKQRRSSWSVIAGFYSSSHSLKMSKENEEYKSILQPQEKNFTIYQ